MTWLRHATAVAPEQAMAAEVLAGPGSPPVREARRSRPGRRRPGSSLGLMTRGRRLPPLHLLAVAGESAGLAAAGTPSPLRRLQAIAAVRPSQRTHHYPEAIPSLQPANDQTAAGPATTMAAVDVGLQALDIAG